MELTFAQESALYRKRKSRLSLHYIYVLVDPRTSRVHYVGCSVTPELRYQEHLREGTQLYGSNFGKLAWIYGLVREGFEPQLVIIEVTDYGHAEDIERIWIELLGDLGAPLTNERKNIYVKATTAYGRYSRKRRMAWAQLKFAS
jgi:hypothetical protein